MDFDDFLSEIKYVRSKNIPFLDDYLESYEEYDMEARIEAESMVLEHAHEALSVTKADALIRMSLDDEIYVEVSGQGGTLIYNDEAFENYKKLITHLHEYKKKHPKEQLKFAFDSGDDYKKYAKKKIEDFKLSSYDYDVFSDIQYKNINNTYKRLDDIEEKYEQANREIYNNDVTWYMEAVDVYLKDEKLTDEDDAKQAFVKWVFEES